MTVTDLGIPDYRYRGLAGRGCPEYGDPPHRTWWYDADGPCCWCFYDGVDELGDPDFVDLTP